MNGSASLPSLWGRVCQSQVIMHEEISVSCACPSALLYAFMISSKWPPAFIFFLFSAVLSSASNPRLCVSYWWIAALPEVSLSSHWPRGLGGCIPDWSPALPLLPDPVWWSASALAGAPLEKMSIVFKKQLRAAEDYVLCKGNIRVPYIILDLLWTEI